MKALRHGSAFIFLIIVLVCTACGTGSGSDQADQVSADASADETVSAQMSDWFVAVEDDERLLQYTGNALSDLSYPGFLLCNGGLLFYDTDYSESDESALILALVDLQSGEMTAQARFSCEFLTDIRQTEEGILLCDSSVGYALLLDENLEQTAKWEIEANYEYWYAGTDGHSVYRIGDGVLERIDLSYEETDADTSSLTASEVLLSSKVSLYGAEPLNGGANISYIDEDQLSCDLWLDLTSGTLTQQPFDAAVLQVTRTDDIWLALIDAGLSESRDYLLDTADGTYEISFESGLLMQVGGSDCLLYEDSEENRFAFYDTEGTLLDAFVIEGEDLWYSGSYCIYSAVYDGYFLLLFSDDGPQLYFRAAGDDEASGTDLTLTLYDDAGTVSEGTAVSEELYARADALGEAYGVEIRIADQCETVYDDFTAEAVTDETLIAAGLDILEEALGAYPDGFLEQLKYDQVTGLQIHLCGTLTPTNDTWGGESYNGLTQEAGNRMIMVLDLSQLYVDTVWHEISHVIDRKLEWDAYCRPKALFSEDDWAALNPDGFEYAYVYSGFEEFSFEEEQAQFFIDAYAMVSPTEDRARIMEFAMAGYDGYFTDDSPLTEKLAYYCACIRDAFDDTLWPQVTAWEQAAD